MAKAQRLHLPTLYIYNFPLSGEQDIVEASRLERAVVKLGFCAFPLHRAACASGPQSGPANLPLLPQLRLGAQGGGGLGPGSGPGLRCALLNGSRVDALACVSCWLVCPCVHVSMCLLTGPDRKRGRQTYTRYQTLELEKEFHFNRYLTAPPHQRSAHALCLTERQIKIWFRTAA